MEFITFDLDFETLYPFFINTSSMEEREVLLEQIVKILKDIETNTCDKEFVPNTNLVEKKLDKIIELHEEQILLLKRLTSGRCTCGKHKDRGVKHDHQKEKKEKKRK